MKGKIYQIDVYGGIMDFTHGNSQKQIRLYLGDKGMIGFRSEDEVDFFSNEQRTMDEEKKFLIYEYF